MPTIINGLAKYQQNFLVYTQQFYSATIGYTGYPCYKLRAIKSMQTSRILLKNGWWCAKLLFMWLVCYIDNERRTVKIISRKKMSWKVLSPWCEESQSHSHHYIQVCHHLHQGQKHLGEAPMVQPKPLQLLLPWRWAECGSHLWHQGHPKCLHPETIQDQLWSLWGLPCMAEDRAVPKMLAPERTIKYRCPFL